MTRTDLHLIAAATAFHVPEATIRRARFYCGRTGRQPNEKINFLAETIALMMKNGKTAFDVEFVGMNDVQWDEESETYEDNHLHFSWDDFVRMALEFGDYDDSRGFGPIGVERSLRIVGQDWWINRHEDGIGSEWWEFNTKPERGDSRVPPGLGSGRLDTERLYAKSAAVCRGPEDRKRGKAPVAVAGPDDDVEELRADLTQLALEVAPPT